MVELTKPWEIRPETAPIVQAVCDRMGCDPRGVRIGIANPHTGLHFWVCRECRDARAMWDDFNKKGISFTYRNKLIEA